VVEPGERRFLIVAGEASGDAHAAGLVRALRALSPCRVAGVTGPALEAAGAERIAPMDDLAVIGFSAILPRLPRIWRAYRRMLAAADAVRPHACILIDSPGFNFRLGPALARRGIKVFYYIAPQVWAWHAERAARMAKWVDRLAVVFRFEQKIFRDAGVDARFVGHPLLDGLAPEVSEADLRRELGVAPHPRLIGLLPGSRAQEIRQHLGPLIQASRRLSATRENLVFVVALSGAAARETGSTPETAVRDLCARAGLAPPGAPGTPPGWVLRVTHGRTRAVQAFATCCAVASGTATLETALFQTPLAIVYRVGALNYAIAKRVIRLSRIGLPNIVAGADVAPELIQGDFTAERVAATLAPWIDDPSERERARTRLAAVRAQLGEPGASARAAALALDLAGG